MTDRETLGDVQDESVDLGEVRDRLGTLGEVWDGLRDPREGLGRIEGPTGRSETGRGTIWEVGDGLGAPR